MALLCRIHPEHLSSCDSEALLPGMCQRPQWLLGGTTVASESSDHMVSLKCLVNVKQRQAKALKLTRIHPRLDCRAASAVWESSRSTCITVLRQSARQQSRFQPGSNHDGFTKSCCEATSERAIDKPGVIHFANVARVKACHLMGAWIVQCGSGPCKGSFCGCEHLRQAKLAQLLRRPTPCRRHGGPRSLWLVVWPWAVVLLFSFSLTPSLLLFLLLMLKKWISVHDDDVLVLVDVF
jgi:hypothetical protein